MSTASTTAVLPLPRPRARPGRATTFPGRATTGTRRRSRAVYWRRRAAVLGGLLAVALLFTFLAGTGGADAQLQHPAAGYVTVEPGQTLWDIAVDHAPAGTDPRAYLATMRRLNGLDTAAVDAWTVLMLPAR